MSVPLTRITSAQQRCNRGSSTVKSYSPQVIRKELALIRSKSDDKVDELMKAVHKVQDLAFHLKAAEKNKTICLKKEEEVNNLRRQLSFWQHMNAVQNEKITQQLERISKGRDELAGLNEQIFEMQERLVKIRVKFGVGNKEHKAPSSENSMTRIGRISASAEPTFQSFGEGIRERQFSVGDKNITSIPIKRGSQYTENLLLENIEETNERNKIITKRCWQNIPNIKSLESPPVLQNIIQKDKIDLKTNCRGEITKEASKDGSNVIRTSNVHATNVMNDSFSECNNEKYAAKGDEHKDNETILKNGESQKITREIPIKNSIENGKTYDEEDSFIKLLSEDDAAANTDSDSDVRTHPVETEELDMITNIPPVIKNLSRSADIRKSRSVSPSNEVDANEDRNTADGFIPCRDKNNGSDIKIKIQGENGEIISESYESQAKLPPILTIDNPEYNEKKNSSNATKRVSFEHSAMLRSACVEGNLDLVKSLNFSGGRDIEGKLLKIINV